MQKEGCLGSDGETSDYQRSTPSPQDSEQRITELGEGENTSRCHDCHVTSVPSLIPAAGVKL